MTFEILSSIVAISTALITVVAAVLKIIIKVNKTLCSLELAVKQLNEYIEKQSKRNESFYESIEDHEIRISKLEYKLQEKETT